MAANVTGNTTAAQTAAANNAWMTWAVQLLQKSMPDAMKQALIESLTKADAEVNGAKHDAVKRLRAVLMHDRTNISPLTIESIRSDIFNGHFQISGSRSRNDGPSFRARQ